MQATIFVSSVQRELAEERRAAAGTGTPEVTPEVAGEVTREVTGEVRPPAEEMA